jgi:hypothetical protein
MKTKYNEEQGQQQQQSATMNSNNVPGLLRNSGTNWRALIL